MRYTLFATLLALLAGNLAACSDIPNATDDAPAAAYPQMATGLPPAASHASPPDYRIGAGDELAIKFYFAPELSDNVTVRPDGKISLMFAQDMRAAGLTPVQLAKRIRHALRKTVKQPELVVVVR